MGNVNFTPITDGSTADAADVNTPLQTIYDEFNGGIDNSNIDVSAAIATSKLADDAGITTGKLANEAVTPAKRSGGFYSNVINAATLNSTGNISITGVGFTPKIVEFEVLEASSGTNASYSSGSMSATSQYANTTALNISGSTVTMARNSSTSACIYRVNASNTNTLRAVYVSMDSDGFTINVTTAGAFDVAYKAYA